MASTPIGIRLSLEGQQATEAGLKKVGDNIGALDANSRKAAAGADLLKNAMAGIATIGTVAAMVQMADAATQLQNQLRLSSGSAREAGTAYTALFQIAQQSRVSFTELGNTYAAIARSGRELGVSQDRLLNVTKSISQAMTISGGSAASMQAALVQLGQGLSSGTLRGEELNSIMEQTPRLAKALADGLGVPIGQLRKLGEAGELTAQQVIGALEKAGPALAREMESATLTVGQAFTLLSNSAVKFTGEADTATGVSTSLATALKNVSTTIDTVGAAIKNNETAFAVVTGGLAGAATLVGVTSLSGVIMTRLVPALLAAQVAAGPIGWITLALGALGGAAIVASKQFGTGVASMGIDAEKLANQITAIDTAMAAGLNTRGYKATESDKAQLASMRATLVEKKKLIDQEIALRNSPALDTRAEDARFAAGTAAYTARQNALKAFTEAGGKYLGTAAKNQTVLNAEVTTARAAFESGAISATEYAQRINEVQASFKKASGASPGLSAAAKANAAAVKADIAAFEEMDKLREKAEQDRRVELEKTMEAYAKAAEAGVAASMAAAVAAETELANYGLLKSEVQALTQAHLEQSRESAAMAGEDVANIEIRIAAQKRLIAATRGLEGRAVSEDAAKLATQTAKDAAAEWQKTSDKINDTLTDALMRGFESGKDFARTLRDTVVNMFKTMVLRPVISAVMNPIAQGITGAMGLSGAAQAGQAVSTGSSLLSGASSLASLYSVASTTVSGLVSGATTISGILGATGSGIATAATYGTAIGSTQTAMLLAQEAGMGLTTSLGSLTTALNAVPVWGWIAAGVAALAIALDDSGTPHTGGSASYSSGGGIKLDANKELDFMAPGTEFSQGVTDASATIAKGIVGLLDQTALTFGKEAGYYAATAFADDSSDDGAWGALKIKLGDSILTDWGKGADNWPGREFGDGEGGAKEYAAAMAVDVRKALDGIGLPEWATAMLDNLGNAPSMEKLEQTVGAITEIQKVSELFGEALGMPTDSLTALISKLGGASAAFTTLDAYYSSFYDAAERTANLTEKTEAAFAALGKTMPALDEGARDAYRAMVDAAAGMDMTVEANRTAYASLLALQGPMNQLAPAFDQAIESMSDTLKGLGRDSANLQVELLQAQGRESEAMALRRVTETEGFNAAEIAAYDYNSSLREQISAIGKARVALDSFNTAAASIKSNQNIVNNVVTNPVTAAQDAVTAAIAGFNNSLKTVTTTTSQVDFFKAFNLGSVNDFRDDVMGWASAFPATFGKYMVDGLTDPEIAAAYYEMANGAATILKGSASEGDIPSWLASAAKIKRPGSDGMVGVTSSYTQSGPGLTEAEIKAIAVIVGEIPKLNGVALTTDQMSALDAVWAALAGLTTAQSTPVTEGSGVVSTSVTPVSTVASDYARALLEAQGDTTGLTAFDKAISDAALIVAGWTQVQIDAVDAAREVTKIATANKEYEKALLTAQGDTTGLEEFNKAISDAALIVAGWTQVQIDAVTAAAEVTKIATATKEYEKALLTAQGDTTGLEEFNKAISDAALITAGWTQEQINAVDAATQSTKLKNENASWQDKLYGLTDTPAQARARQMQAELTAATNTTTKALIRQYYAQLDLRDAATAATEAAAKGATDAMSALQRAVAAQRKIVQVSRDAAAEAVSEITSVFDTLQSAVKELYGAVDSTAQMQADQGREFIKQALATAQSTGYLPEGKELADAINAAKGGTAEFASQFEKDFAALTLAGDLSLMEALSKSQLTEAERMLQIADDQLTALDDVLDLAQKQLDAANGINTSVLSVADAVNALALALSAVQAAKPYDLQAAAVAAQAAAQAASPNSYTWNATDPKTGNGVGGAFNSTVTDRVRTYTEDTVTAVTPVDRNNMSAVYAAVTASIGIAAAEKIGSLEELYSTAQTVGIPGFAVGINRVPFDMTARIHEGEAVVPAAFNPFNPNAKANNMGSNTERLEKLVEGLTKEVQRLQSIVTAGNASNERIATAVNGNPDRPVLVEIA